jgi:hypothetical protein
MVTEYETLWRDHGCTLVNPHDYEKQGAFYQHVRRYEYKYKDDFHPVEKVERLRELAKERVV